MQRLHYCTNQFQITAMNSASGPVYTYTVIELYIRGVLGNKCAGHHNLKTVKIREIMCKIKYTENSFLHIKAA